MKEHLKSLRNAQKNLPQGTLENYAAQVNAKVQQFEDDQGQLTGKEIDEAQRLMEQTGEIQASRQQAQSRRAYSKELRKVVETADVVIQVLDARDPEGCRSEEIEKSVTIAGKKLVQVLNKIDLVPPQNARAWQRYLRSEFPVVLFKATQQEQQSKLAGGIKLHKKSFTENTELVDKLTGLSSAVGSENLLNILKNYARIGDKTKSKQTITVGVVGFPNVGKSSLINSLKRSRAAATGNQPGVTKVMQEIQLDKDIILLDSPGVILSTSEQADSLLLRQAVKVEELDDPMRPVEALLNRVPHDELLKLYKIGPFASVESLLSQVARKKGMLKSGGVGNLEEAARAVIRDFLNGKIKYCTAPPASALENVSSDEEMAE